MSLPEVKLPNVRKLFLPDPGHIICDIDLSGADAQVVAWEAADAELKRAFREGLDVHSANGTAIWGDAFVPKGKRPGAKFEMRDECKRAVHGTNYGASARTLAITLSWKVAEAEAFKSKWFRLHPGILEWHRRCERNLQSSRRVSNPFGDARTYFDRVDALLPQALAWIPQSTVGLVAAEAETRLQGLPWLDMLLEVHDSLIFQLPYHRFTPSNLETIQRHIQVEVPYPDPLIIPWGLAASDRSWGDCKKLKWDLSNAEEAKAFSRGLPDLVGREPPADAGEAANHPA